MDYIKKNLNNETVVTCIILVVAAVIVWYYILPYIKKIWQYEGMDVAANTPFVDPQTGTLIDGPGFERSDDVNAYLPLTPDVPSNYYFLDDGANGKMSIQHNLFSPSCCSEQWPTPFKQKWDPYVCQNKDKFVGSRMMGQSSFGDSGCACITKDQAAFLYNRGGNGREWF